MKKHTCIAVAAVIFLAVGLWVFQEHAESLSGEIVSFVFAFSTAVVVGLLSYFKGFQKGKLVRMDRQKKLPPDFQHEGSMPV